MRFDLLALLCLAGLAGCGPADGTRVSIPGLAEAWDLTSIPSPVDIEFFDGTLFVLAGDSAATIWQVGLKDDPIPVRLPSELPPERGRVLGSNDALLFVAGAWGSSIYSVFPTGEVGGAFRRVDPSRTFLPWSRGDFLVSARPRELGYLVKASARSRQREVLRGWGVLPDTRVRKVTKAESSPLGDVILASDRPGRAHALVQRDGMLVQYRDDGIPTLVSWLPDDMVDVGQSVMFAGYGQPLRRMVNGFEADCDGRLWASVGDADQRVAVIDPTTYEVIGRSYFAVKDFPAATWSRCGDWVVGISPRAGRVILGRVE